MVYGWFYSRLPLSEADTWQFYLLSKNETDWLLHDPVGFLKDIFSYGYAHPGNLFSGVNSYWNDLKSSIVIKLIAVFNVLTAKNYYADMIFFNFLFFFGPVAFFRLMMHYYPQKKSLLILSVFMLPSFLFWCSGMHKEGLIFSAIAITIYVFNKQLQQKRIVLKYCFVIVICFAALFALRNFLLLLLVPAMFAWFVASRVASKKWLVFLSIYGIGIILFFGLPHVNSLLDFPQYVIGKQDEFKQLPGNSVIPVPALEPTVKSFVHFIPTSLDIAFLRPHINEAKNLSYIPAAIENLLLIVLMIGCIFFRDKKAAVFSVNLFCLFYSLSVMILSGYTVTFSGSIVRYKSIVLPLLITFFLLLIDGKILPKILRQKEPKTLP